MDPFERLFNDYMEWPNLLREVAGAEYPEGEPLEGQAMLTGMGGSSHGAKVISRCLKERRIRASNDFRIRSHVGRGDLTVAISSSGETLETITSLREAVSMGAEGIAVAGGGTLLKVAEEMGASGIKVRVLSSPRSSFPSLYAAPAIVLESYGLASGARPQMLKLADLLDERKEDLLDERGEPAMLADWARARKLIVYSSWHTEPIALRFSAMLNEYAKTRCYVAVAPELAHNEIEALDDASALLVIRDPSSEDRELKASLDSVEEVASEKGAALTEFKLPVDSECLVRSGYAVFALDLAALWLAKRRGVEDPYSTPNIGLYKEKLRKKLSA